MKRSGKYDRRAKEGVLVGYCKGDAYKILLDNTNRVVESKDETFEEWLAHVESYLKECMLFGEAVREILLDELGNITEDGANSCEINQIPGNNNDS